MSAEPATLRSPPTPLPATAGTPSSPAPGKPNFLRENLKPVIPLTPFSLRKDYCGVAVFGHAEDVVLENNTIAKHDAELPKAGILLSNGKNHRVSGNVIGPTAGSHITSAFGLVVVDATDTQIGPYGHPSLDKKLCILCWPVEEAPPDEIPHALPNWEARREMLGHSQLSLGL